MPWMTRPKAIAGHQPRIPRCARGVPERSTSSTSLLASSARSVRVQDADTRSAHAMGERSLFRAGFDHTNHLSLQQHLQQSHPCYCTQNAPNENWGSLMPGGQCFASTQRECSNGFPTWEPMITSTRCCGHKLIPGIAQLVKRYFALSSALWLLPPTVCSTGS
jgi:hypothetical protein